MKASVFLLRVILFVFLPVIIGLTLYDWFSPYAPLGITILDFTQCIRPSWNGLIYNVPDGLWSFSLMSMMLIIWKGENSKIRYIWIVLTIIFGLGCEFLQSTDLLRGTFDWWDIVAIVAGMLLSLLILFKRG
jgi:hypothetical protein